MFEKKIHQIFCSVFVIILFLPLVFINLKPNQISESENRFLASPPHLYLNDGSLNTEYFSNFETWFNDNIGFRSEIVAMNGITKYNLFDKIPDSNYRLGPNRELNYATDTMVQDYQHFNLKSDQELELIIDSFEIVNNYIESKGAQFYYFQCWDKHSIYPEYFPNTVIQYGKESKTDQVINALEINTNVEVINPKQILIDEKKNYDTYSVWGDATHWTQRGAYIGYQYLMQEINNENNNKFRVLNEDDYEISIADKGSSFLDAIHEEDYEEVFQIKNPKAIATGEKPLYPNNTQGDSTAVFINNDVKNDDVLLVIGDSYINSFLLDDLAESFSKTVMIWGDNAKYLKEIMEYYKPTIVLCENAERVDRTGHIIAAAERIK